MNERPSPAHQGLQPAPQKPPHVSAGGRNRQPGQRKSPGPAAGYAGAPGRRRPAAGPKPPDCPPLGPRRQCHLARAGATATGSSRRPGRAVLAQAGGSHRGWPAPAPTAEAHAAPSLVPPAGADEARVSGRPRPGRQGPDTAPLSPFGARQPCGAGTVRAARPRAAAQTETLRLRGAAITQDRAPGGRRGGDKPASPSRRPRALARPVAVKPPRRTPHARRGEEAGPARGAPGSTRRPDT